MRVYFQERHNPLQEYRNMKIVKDDLRFEAETGGFRTITVDAEKYFRVDRNVSVGSDYKARRNVQAAKTSVKEVTAKLLGAYFRAKSLGGDKVAAKCVASFKFSVPSASGGLRADRAALNARLKDGSPAFLENDRSNRVSSPADRGTVRKNRQAIHGANTKRGGARYFASKKASAMVESTLDAAKLLRAIDTVCRLADRDTSTMNARDKRSHFRSMDHACHQFYQAARLQACPCASCERECAE